MIRLLPLLLGALLSIPAASGPQEPGWIWIHGRLADEALQKEYMESARRMFEWYQKRGLLPGRLVAEEDLKTIPADHVVFIGPIEAFRHPDRFGLPLEAAGSGKVTVAGRLLDEPRTGIFLADRKKTRIAYTGLSLEGFRDIFTVPTGRKACTVTCGKGRVRFEADYGKKGLVVESFLEEYPSAEDLADLLPPGDALVKEPVTAGPGLEKLAPKFRKWLDSFVAGKRVLFVGESHWNRGVNRLFNLVVEDLLEHGRLEAVFLELDYSFSGFYDHYASEPDDGRAARFLETRLHPLVAQPSVLELLDILRTWNRAHPGKKVHVACMDMEWNAVNVFRNILRPYFRRAGRDFPESDFIRLAQEGRAGEEALRRELDERLAEARKKKITGAYPFLTPAYIERVITNLLDTLAIEDPQGDRQRAIIRNVTKFHGDLLKEGLVLFKGGGWHAIKRKIPGEDFYREAAYLACVFPATKGKVATLYVQGLGYRFGGIAGVDPRTRMSSATNYAEFVTGFRSALADGRAEKDGWYLLDSGGLGLFERLVAKEGYRTGRDVLRIVSVDWDELAGIYGREVLQSRAQDYDAVLYVLRSDIEVMRPRVFEGK